MRSAGRAGSPPLPLGEADAQRRVRVDRGGRRGLRDGLCKVPVTGVQPVRSFGEQYVMQPVAEALSDAVPYRHGASVERAHISRWVVRNALGVGTGSRTSQAWNSPSLHMYRLSEMYRSACGRGSASGVDGSTETMSECDGGPTYTPRALASFLRPPHLPMAALTFPAGLLLFPECYNGSLNGPRPAP